MTDTPSTPRPVSVRPPAGGRLTRLVGRTGAGDRQAFRRLYAGLAARTWRAAVARLGCPDAASSVTDATFVEVWHLAKSFDPTVDDGEGWIASITARRCQDRLRASNMVGSRVVGDLIADYDMHLRRELGALLAADLATFCDEPLGGAAADSCGGVVHRLPA
jgi:DNA-directed RNA polymerase specialized sigma24 family protein